jgi:hypothetical protein
MHKVNPIGQNNYYGGVWTYRWWGFCANTVERTGRTGCTQKKCIFGKNVIIPRQMGVFSLWLVLPACDFEIFGLVCHLRGFLVEFWEDCEEFTALFLKC